MPSLFIYIIRWAVVLTLLYSLYGLLLRRETFHRFNRAVLVAILVLSAVLPLCEVRTSHPTPVAMQVERIENVIVPEGLDAAAETSAWSADGHGAAMMADSAARQTNTASSWSFIGRLAIVLYALGVAAFLMHYLLSLLSFVRLVAMSRLVEKRDGVRILVNERIETPCSWMRWVILKEKPVTPESCMICEHEMAHAHLRHSWDMLIAELTARMLWPLPFAWMLRRDLRDVHEYEADRYVVSHGAAVDDYGMMLIHHAAQPAVITAANQLGNKSIKNRLAMMYTKKSSLRAALKAAYLLPLVLLAVVAFARPSAMKEIEQIVEKEAEKAPLLSPKALVASAVPQEAPALTLPETVVESTPDSVFVNEDVFVETPIANPSYPGGEEALLAFLKANLRHPGEDGRALVQFIVTETGDMENIHIVRSASPAIDAEALRVVSMLGRWNPATNNGKPFAVSYTLPITFRSAPTQGRMQPATYVDGGAKEKPRGIYKLTRIIRPDGQEMLEPYLQFKLCLPTFTLMLSVDKNRFRINDNDNWSFAYTGSEPDPDNPHMMRVYDCNADGFTLKWWSTYTNHPVFPSNDWCTERYESVRNVRLNHTEQLIVNALQQTATPSDAASPLADRWQFIGNISDLGDVKSYIKRALESSERRNSALCCVFTNEAEVNFIEGRIKLITLTDNEIKYRDGKTITVQWIDHDNFVLKNDQGGKSLYNIWHRLPHDTSVLDLLDFAYYIMTKGKNLQQN